MRDKKIYIVDYKIDHDIELYLKSNDIKYIKTLKSEHLYDEIDGHPDIIACNIGDITVFEPRSYDILNEKLEGFNIVKGNACLSAKYPYDIAYNVVATDKYIIGNIKYIDDTIKNIAKSKDLKFIDVRQGYTKCSVISLPNDVFVTSDESIYKELIYNDVKCYYIDIDDIYLSDRYNGFLGGCCGQINGKLLFFGDISLSSSGKCIKTILDNEGVDYDMIHNHKLTDYGGAIAISRI